MEPRLLRAAEGLAVQVAFDGELADPPVPAPPELKPILRFRKLSASTRTIIRRVLDGDADFRARVAAEATEDAVGRAGWLWLHRPDGWFEEIEASTELEAPEEAPGTGRLRRALAGAEAAAVRHRTDAEEAAAARVRAEERATTAATALAAMVEEHDTRAAELARMQGERTRAVRELKAVEAERDELRRELKQARMATREAEVELAEVRAGRGLATAAEGAPSGGSGDRAAAKALAEARDAAAALAASLDDAVESLGGGIGVGGAGGGDRAGDRGRRASAGRGRGADRRRPGGRGARGRAPSLPMGVRAGTVEAARHLLTRPEVLVVVDGYNLARAAWDDVLPEEERRRTIAMLEEVQGRRGGEVVVVFDGDDTCVAPAASRWVRVRFSATGVTADDVIVDLVEGTVDRPVVVVTSDREVVDQVEDRGAATISSATFLDARP